MNPGKEKKRKENKQINNQICTEPQAQKETLRYWVIVNGITLYADDTVFLQVITLATACLQV